MATIIKICLAALQLATITSISSVHINSSNRSLTRKNNFFGEINSSFLNKNGLQSSDELDDEENLSSADPASCACSKCWTATRQPHEMFDSSVSLKCSPDRKVTASMDQCINHSSFTNLILTPNQPVNLARFCFYECVPTQGFQNTPEQEQCAKMDHDTLSLIADSRLQLAAFSGLPEASSGAAILQRGQDPAKILVQLESLKVKEISLVKTKEKQAREEAEKKRKLNSQLQNAGKPEVEKVIPDELKDAAANTEKTAEEIKNKNIKVVKRIADKEMQEEATEDGSHGINAYNVVDEVHKAALQARAYAREATDTAQDAYKALADGESKVWKTALQSGKKAILKAKAEADEKARVDAENLARVTNTVEMKAAEAAAKASEPYFTSMLRAQALVRDYQTKAEAKAAQANKLEASARDKETSANAAKAKGDVVTANGLIKDAKTDWDQSQEIAKQAREFLRIAEETNAGIPKFTAAARAAAAKAAYDANPAWHPPPAPAR